MTTADDRKHLASRAAEQLRDVPSENLIGALAPFVANVDLETLRTYAIPCLADDIRHARRDETLRAEREAERAAAAAEAQREQEGQQEQPEEEPTGDDDQPGPTEDELAAQRARKRAEREAEKARKKAQREAANAAAQQAVATFLSVYARSFVIEFNPELLEMKVAIDNSGKTVELGEMTWEQHRSRIQMLTHNIRANAEDIARHTKALEAGENSGYANLNELLAAEEAAS